MSRATRGRLLAVLVASAVLVPVCTANAATITGCVNKKTGELRIRQGKAAKKKCPKGWKKLHWNTNGPAGKQGIPGVNGTNGTNGAPGPIINVKDATGAVVGQLLGVFPEGAAIYIVFRDGGYWFYLGSGQLFSLFSPEFKTNDCSGTAYLTQSSSSNFSAAQFAALIGGPFRIVFRTLNAGTFGTPTAYKAAGATEPATSLQLYSRNGQTGTCTADGSTFTGTLAALQVVPAPPDFTGPLTIG
jgi:hypothetical protein